MTIEENAGTDRSRDNRTHHLVRAASGNHRCIYCKKWASEIGSEPTHKYCPSAP